MNTEIINTLIEYPSIIVGHFILEPLATAVLAYYLVWLIMRPKYGREMEGSFFLHSCGVAVAVIGSAIFRIIAMATFAGRSAYEPSNEDGTLVFYMGAVPSLVAAGYILLLRFFGTSDNMQQNTGKNNDQESLLSGFNPFRCTTETTRRLSIALLIASLLIWVTWIEVETTGFSELKPIGWFIFFGIPIGVYIVLLIVLPILRQATKEVRFMISISLVWVFMVGAWGYIWEWDDVFSFDRYLALFVLPPICTWLTFLLWKWSKAG